MNSSDATSALAAAVSAFGADAKATLRNPAITGEPEDQLRAPLIELVKTLAGLTGLAAHDTHLVGETKLSDLMIRPDFAVTRKGALIGFIEVKAPGKGADPTKFKGKHDKEQWEKLKALPNLIYTDGNAFSLWRDGKLALQIVKLDGDVETSGKALAGPPELISLFTTFYNWDPIAPRTPRQLAETTARLCRLLRDEVTEQLSRSEPSLTKLMEDWRQLLFPSATPEEFADGYAQAVTFGLLMAKARRISLKGGIEDAARALRKSNTLIGSALRLLTEQVDEEHILDTSLKTLTAVLDVVDWDKLSKGEPEAWLYFYELFLQQYDVRLRKRTGSYYTPPQIVTAMVRLVDEALRSASRFNLGRGLASTEVTLADPAVGTGTFLLGVLQQIKRTIEADEGAGSVPAGITAALSRLIGFELQFGPFAVAQLRVLAELIDLVSTEGDGAPEELQKVLSEELRLYITDTLADPDEEFGWIPSSMTSVADSRRAANQIKRHEPITVVIGNPPYKEKAKGFGGWVEDRGKGHRAPLDDWQPPREWGVGAHAKHLRNLYIYFWRWAAWKVFGGEAYRSGTEKGDLADWTRRQGVVCFITVSGFLNGPGFQKMRADLRRDADEIWVIDCSPEGHQAPVGSRVFEGVQQPVCIVMALRSPKPNEAVPARVRFRSLPEGDRTDVKFKALENIDLDGAGWEDTPNDWRAPFLPAGASDWTRYPFIEHLFAYNGPGVITGRQWVISPDKETLEKRWDSLKSEKDIAKQQDLFQPQLRHGKLASRHVEAKVRQPLGHRPTREIPVGSDIGPFVGAERYGFRSFDRQWLAADNRLINDARPVLWNAHSRQQVYLTALRATSPTSGPAISFTALIPDFDHYRGSFGGRVFPLWGDPAATEANISPLLLSELSLAFGREVSPGDVLGYIAAIAAHPGYVNRFRSHLRQPGLRIPCTASSALFDEAVTLGREVIWLHTFGERFADGRPAGAPRVEPASAEPTIPKEGVLPKTLAAMPHELEYNAAARCLRIGTGFIANVSPQVWAYEVSGKRVLSQWWSYRRQDRSKPPMGDKRPPSELSKIQPKEWLPEYTTELLNVLRVLTRLVALEPAQDGLLRRIVEGPTLDADTLGTTGALSNISADPADENEVQFVPSEPLQEE